MQVQEGPGWRLLVDPARQPFPVLVGGEGWAAELSAAEAQALQRAADRLQGQLAAIADQLMAEEQISLEWECELEREAGQLWLELAGDRRQWQLRFVLTPDRGQRAVEGGWSTAASPAIAAALAQLSLDTVCLDPLCLAQLSPDPLSPPLAAMS